MRRALRVLSPLSNPLHQNPEGIRFDKDAIDAFSYSLDCHSIEI